MGDRESNIMRFAGGQAEVMDWLRQNAVDKVRLEWTDLHGISRGKRLALATFEHGLDDGIPFAALLFAIDLQARWLRGTRFGEEMSFGDFWARPDLRSLRLLRHEPNTAQVMTRLTWSDGSPVVEYPRNVLEEVLGDLAELDFRALAAPEFEFYFLDSNYKVMDTGANAYAMQKRWGFREEERALLDAVSAHVDYEACNYEFGPGQYEITVRYGEALQIADDGHFFRNTMKEAAVAIDRRVTFMAKPFDVEAGSSCHFHFSLEDTNGKNAFHDPDDPLGLSRTCRLFIGGVLAHLQELALLYLPTPNSYRRLAPDSFAPLSIAWGIDNRVAAVRVINYRPESTRIELRVPGGDVSVYLGLAALIASGIDGIRNEIDPGAPSEGHLDYDPNIPKITNEWGVALSAFEASKFAPKAFGKDMCSFYGRIKRMEYERIKFLVTQEERDEYIELI
ncbi:MAG: glutamine synthetase family protein [Alphaproteobacteria bacterium]